MGPKGVGVVLHAGQAAREGLDVVICDTSGRLHTNANLMGELAKCARALGKRLPGAPHETLLVLDRTTGAPRACHARPLSPAMPRAWDPTFLAGTDPECRHAPLMGVRLVLSRGAWIKACTSGLPSAASVHGVMVSSMWLGDAPCLSSIPSFVHGP